MATQRKKPERSAMPPPGGSGSAVSPARPTQQRTRLNGESAGLIEVFSCSATLITADVMAKAADVRLVGIEQNTSQGMGIKVTGRAGDVARAIEAGADVSRGMNCYIAHAVWPRYSDEAGLMIHSPQEHNALMDSYELMLPGGEGRPAFKEMKGQLQAMSTEEAIGFIETQGLVGLLEAADAMCKAGNVRIIGKEKLGGGFITVIVRGKVADVRAGIDAGAAACNAVGGKLILAHVIARPHAELAALLPQ